MKRKNSNRREFLADSGSVLAGGWLSLALPVLSATAQTACSKREENAGFTNLTSQEASDIEAIAEQILPSDDTPGAREAGVIWFIDAALGGFRQQWAQSIKDGLRQLNESLHDGKNFSDLTWAQQTDVLKANETTEYFEKMHFLTIAGMFAMPSYGGNREKLGWALLGFEDRHVWQPPFGYYDANYSSETSS
jgi:gluconate 2-dehydrogenase gamma chain